MAVRALRGKTAGDGARLCRQAGAGKISSSGFVELLDDAAMAGEIGPANTRFLAHVLRQIAFVVRDKGGVCVCANQQGMKIL